MAMIYNSQGSLEIGICLLFQKGTFAYWSWFDGMVPRNLHMCGYLRQSDCIGICGHIFIPGREEHECGCFLCAVSSRVDGVSCC
jgi:phage terminase large subunit-like protein